MNMKSLSRVFAASALLVALGACKAGPPAISDLKVGKDKEVTQVADSFAAADTIYAVAKIDNPPENGKVAGRLVVVDVPGQQAGPIPGLETSIDLTGGMNVANFNFSAPTAGWPNGKYRIEVVLMDGTGAEKGQKSAEFTTSGNTAAPAPAADATATDTTATDATATDTTATDATATDTTDSEAPATETHG